jgi:hypothetical protein
MDFEEIPGQGPMEEQFPVTNSGGRMGHIGGVPDANDAKRP